MGSQCKRVGKGKKKGMEGKGNKAARGGNVKERRVVGT